MKRIIYLSPLVLLWLSAAAWGWPLPCLNAGIHCLCPPPPACPDCGPPCDRRLPLCCRSSDHARQLIAELGSTCCGERVRAVEKLGSRLHADFCRDPEVLSTLVRALQCDACWEVRRAAAWGIARQKARTDLSVMALYLASKLDPHFLVRDAASDALGVLLVCRKDCFKDLFAQADQLAKSLRGKYKPGSSDCVSLLEGSMPAVAAPTPPAAGKGEGTTKPGPSW